MKKAAQGTPDAFLLAAASLSYLNAAPDQEQLRSALQKALRSTQWRKPEHFDAAAKKQALALLAAYFAQNTEKHCDNLQKEYQLAKLSNQDDESLLKLLLHCFAFNDCEEMAAQDFFAALPALVSDADAVISSFQFCIIAETARLCLAASDIDTELATADANAREKLTSLVISKSGAIDKSLPAMLAMRLASEIQAKRQALDESLDWYAHSSRTPLANHAIRQLFRIALVALSGEAISADLLKKALLAAAKPALNEKQKKFFRTGLVKAANSRSRELAFQTLYALSFGNPKSDDDLESIFHGEESISAIFTPISFGSPQGFLWSIVSGVAKNPSVLDEKINKFSHKWRKERLGRIELLLLRMGLHEIESGLTPPKVVISEILELANLFGVPEAKSLINGIMDAALKTMDQN